MRTIIEFKDGHTETVEDATPNVYCGEVSCIDSEGGVMSDDVPLSEIKRIVFENDD